MGLTLRNVEKKKFVLSSSLRTPDPFPLLRDPRLLINPPRNCRAQECLMCHPNFPIPPITPLFPPCHPYICSLCLLSLFLLCKWDYLHQFSWFHISVQFSPVQSLSHVRLFATPKIAARQASLCALIKKKICDSCGSDSKESTCNVGDLGLIPELGKPPGGGHGNPLQYSCLENPHGQRSLVGCSHGVAKSWTWLKWLSTRNKESATSCMDLILQGGMKASRLEAITLATSVCRFGHCCQMFKACLCQGS